MLTAEKVQVFATVYMPGGCSGGTHPELAWSRCHQLILLADGWERRHPKISGTCWCVIRVTVITQDAHEVTLTERDDVVGAFSYQGAKDAFAVRILQRTFWAH